MMDTIPDQPTSARPELNPFAFPPETNSFFTLLVIAALLVMVELAVVLADSTNWIIFTTVPLLFLVLLLAGGLYLSHPLRIKYRQQLREIKPEDDLKFVAAIQEIANESGLRRMPRLLTDSKPTSMSGQAFGITNDHSLRLGGGLRLLLRREPEVFKAIIRHELAHIANKDVSRAYLTRSIWLAVLFLTILPMLLLMTRFLLLSGAQSPTEIQNIQLNMLKIILIFLLITAIYSNLLRSRELYADWRAKTWGAGQALASILQRNMGRPAAGNPMFRPWRLHPNSEDRLNALQRPFELFRIRPSLAFFVGSLPGLMVGGFITQRDLFLQITEFLGLVLQSIFGENLLNGPAGPIVIGFLAMVIMGVPSTIVIVFITNALGVAVQRDVIARLDSNQPGWSTYISLWIPAILVAAGYRLGGLLSLSSILELVPSLFSSLQGLLFVFLLFTITISFAVMVWLGLSSSAFLTRKIIGMHTGTSSPTGKMLLLRLILTINLMLLCVPLILADLAVEQAAAEMSLELVSYFMPGVGVAVLLGLMITGGLFLITWLIVAINASAKLRCPQCGQIPQHKYAVGHSCERCNKMLSGWLYLNVK